MQSETIKRLVFLFYQSAFLHHIPSFLPLSSLTFPAPKLSLSHGSVTLPIKSGTLAWSLHSRMIKGRRAEKEGWERENDIEVTAPASTPCSVSARKALCLASSRTSLSSE